MTDLAVATNRDIGKAPWVALASCLLVALVVFKLAWIADDASITSRVIANTLSGHGPNFNITERAQAMTHPLWFLVTAALSALGIDIILVLILLGVACTVATLWLLVKDVRPSGAAALCLLFVFSYTLTEYGTSGLENSLSWLLLTLLWVSARGGSPLLVGLFAGLAVLNRLDLAVVAVPFVVLWLRGRAETGNRAAVIGLVALPPLAWAAFSWLYYGSPLPETFFAKLNTQLPTVEVLGQGFYYLYDLFRYDLISGLILIAGAHLARRGLVSRESRLLVAAGSGLYSAYVIWVGGDFMSGRMWSVPIICSFIAIVDWVSGLEPAGFRKRHTLVMACIAPILALPLLVPWTSLPILRSPIDPPSRGNGISSQNAGIVDEWAYHVQDGRGLVQWIAGTSPTLEAMNRSLEAWPREARVDEVRVQCGNVGWAATMVGPRVHYVVHCGLSDPFLARLPFDPGSGPWRIGHYHRDIPNGYLTALATGRPDSIADRYRELFVGTSLARRVPDKWDSIVSVVDP